MHMTGRVSYSLVIILWHLGELKPVMKWKSSRRRIKGGRQVASTCFVVSFMKQFT